MIRAFKPEDLPALHALLTSNHWEYFLDPVINEKGLAKRDEKYFSSDVTRTLVYINTEGILKGYIRFFDIEDDDSPDFVLSLDESIRGKGIGKELLKTGVSYVFETYAKIRRIEATTRIDNIPMQKTFKSVGFRHEGTYKKAWENRQTGEYVDSLCYAILREEFKG